MPITIRWRVAYMSKGRVVKSYLTWAKSRRPRRMPRPPVRKRHLPDTRVLAQLTLINTVQATFKAPALWGLCVSHGPLLRPPPVLRKDVPSRRWGSHVGNGAVQDFERHGVASAVNTYRTGGIVTDSILAPWVADNGRVASGDSVPTLPRWRCRNTPRAVVGQAHRGACKDCPKRTPVNP